MDDGQRVIIIADPELLLRWAKKPELLLRCAKKQQGILQEVFFFMTYTETEDPDKHAHPLVKIFFLYPL